MNQHQRTQLRIAKLEKHAWCLLAKAQRKPGTQLAPIKGTRPMVMRAFLAFHKAALLRAGLQQREEARDRERKIRMMREPQREVPKRRRTAGGEW
jgi:hypothetical protein